MNAIRPGDVHNTRKKPVIVNVLNPEKVEHATLSRDWKVGQMGDGIIRVHTMEGSYDADPSTVYLIKGVDGEVYPIDRDIFHRTYQLEGLAEQLPTRSE